jgi:hypothetical protein
MHRNFKRLPGQKFTAVAKLDDEIDNIVKQLNLFSAEAVTTDTTKDLFEIYKFDKKLYLKKEDANLENLYDFVATLALKLGEINAIKTIKR